ncbi:restriction endonuclease subunit S [Pseudorhodobacter sp. MZDSW-24AT]|uniref:restriction endonuclease subunit S n=1 Tax=Pseudorhodobacter sp. MZDSW-24AT TaxID=2052957 RepID=UPI000C1E3093|nr:restriction endonuclease subunit S [Pseudorhodobacter sp. MZDSW-24AT]PJF08836.1 restriction endonuclease subunit S [Pseudorhodobacter sp. MZDSW-24AT]
MSWPTYALDELGVVSRGRSRHRPRDAQHLYGGPFPFVQTGDVKAAPLYLTSYSQTYSEAGLAQSKLWPAGTLCITIAANIAETCILGIDACFPDSIIGFVADPGKADTTFIKYQFDAVMREKMKRVSQGVAQDNLSQEKLLSFRFPVPDLLTQQRIAGILSAYDDLIENNRRRIGLLEQAARLLSREWFVHLRFPGHETAKIVDGLPEGWERMPASEAMHINPRTTWKASESKLITMVPMGALSTSGMNCDPSLFERREQPAGVKFMNGDTLFARITPCLENGKTSYVNFLQEGEVACGSTEFVVFRERRISRFMAYLLAREEGFRKNAISSMVGSSGRQRVQPSCFDKYLVPVPPKPVVEDFDRVVEPMFREIEHIDKSIGKLTRARDLLLPRLMDGRIPV